MYMLAHEDVQSLVPVKENGILRCPLPRESVGLVKVFLLFPEGDFQKCLFAILFRQESFSEHPFCKTPGPQEFRVESRGGEG